VNTTEACKSCGAPILWAKTEQGHKIPIDEGPTLDGNIAIQPTDDRKGWLAFVAGPLEAVPGSSSIRRKSHFATCPNAAKHRRKSRS